MIARVSFKMADNEKARRCPPMQLANSQGSRDFVCCWQNGFGSPRTPRRRHRPFSSISSVASFLKDIDDVVHRYDPDQDCCRGFIHHGDGQYIIPLHTILATSSWSISVVAENTSVIMNLLQRCIRPEQRPAAAKRLTPTRLAVIVHDIEIKGHLHILVFLLQALRMASAAVQFLRKAQ